MANNNEYQIKIVREDGIEKMSGWMNSTEQVAEALAAVHWSQGKSYWLMVRDVPNCREKILEYPIMNIPSPRYSPHNSRYLRVVGLKNRYSV